MVFAKFWLVIRKKTYFYQKLRSARGKTKSSILNQAGTSFFSARKEEYGHNMGIMSVAGNEFVHGMTIIIMAKAVF